jgi:hypothetical protein
MGKNDRLYTHFKIPRALSSHIEQVAINQSPYGYRTVSEFVVEAVRIKLQYMEEMSTKRKIAS